MADIKDKNVVVPQSTPQPVPVSKPAETPITLQAYFAFKKFDKIGQDTRNFVAKTKGIENEWKTFSNWEEALK